MVTALIKFTQSAVPGIAGEAYSGIIGSGVTIENGDNSNVLSWKIELLYARPPSTLEVVPGVPTVLGMDDITPPTGTFTPDVPGSYRIRLTVYDAIGLLGNSDQDIRNFIVAMPGRNLIIPPYQALPDPLPLPGSNPPAGSPAPKPDEMNYGGQNYGWGGDNSSNLLGLNESIVALDGIIGLPDAGTSVQGDVLQLNRQYIFNTPVGVAWDGSNLWTCDSASALVRRIDPVTGNVVATIDLSAFGVTTGVKIAIDSSNVYVSHGNYNLTSVIDIATNSVVGLANNGINSSTSVTSDGIGNFWVASPGASNGITKFNLATVLAAFPAQSSSVVFISLTATPLQVTIGGGYLWCTTSAFQLVKINTSTDVVISTFTGTRNYYTPLYAFGSVWVTTSSSNTLDRFNPVTDPPTIIASVTGVGPAGSDIRGLAASTTSIWAGIYSGPVAAITEVSTTLGSEAIVNVVFPTNSADYMQDMTWDGSFVWAMAYISSTPDVGLLKFNTTAQVGSITYSSTNIAFSHTSYLQGFPLSPQIPSVGEIWIFDGSGWSLTLPSGSPTGPAGGQLGDSYPNPTVRGLRETTGPTALTLAGIPDATYLKRVGTTVSSATPSGRGVEDGAGQRAVFQSGYHSNFGSEITVGVLTSPRGAVYIDNAIWIADNVNNLIQKIDISSVNSSGLSPTFLAKSDIATATPAGTGPVDIASDGSYIWSVNATSRNVSRVSLAGVVVDSSPTSGIGTVPVRILYDGTYMLVCGGTTLYRFNSSLIMSSLASFTSLSDMIWDGLYLWVLDSGAGNLVKIDTSAMAIVSTVVLNGAVGNTNKLASDGSFIYVTRDVSTVLAIHIDSLIQETITISSFTWASGGITYDGMMIVCSDGAANSGIRYIDPTSKKVIGVVATIFSSALKKFSSLGPGWIIGYNEQSGVSTSIQYLIRNDPPRAVTTTFYPGQSGFGSTPSKAGTAEISVAAASGVISLTSEEVRRKVIRLTGTSAAAITLQYRGGGPGPYIILNDAFLSSGNLTVDVDGSTLTFAPQPVNGEAVMFAAFGNPTSVYKINDIGLYVKNGTLAVPAFQAVLDTNSNSALCSTHQPLAVVTTTATATTVWSVTLFVSRSYRAVGQVLTNGYGAWDISFVIDVSASGVVTARDGPTVQVVGSVGTATLAVSVAGLVVTLTGTGVAATTITWLSTIQMTEVGT